MSYPPVMMTPAAMQEATDRSHLKLLSIFYYVKAGLCLLVLGFVILHCVIMMTVFNHAMAEATAAGRAAPSVSPIGIMVGVYVVAAAFIIAMGVLDLIVARALPKAEQRTLTMVVAGFSCLSFPLGTALGVFTFIVLNRPSVQVLYQQRTFNG